MFFAELGEIVVDLAGAEDDAARAGGDSGVGENLLKTAAGTIFDGAGGAGVAEHPLGGHDHQGLDGFADGLAAEEMEIVGRGGGIGDDPVVLGAELEEALEPGARMFRTLTVVAVGKKKGDAGGNPGRRDSCIALMNQRIIYPKIFIAKQKK